MMCLLPSHFDVQYHNRVCVCARARAHAEDEGVMFEQFSEEGVGGEVDGILHKSARSPRFVSEQFSPRSPLPPPNDAACRRDSWKTVPPPLTLRERHFSLLSEKPLLFFHARCCLSQGVFCKTKYPIIPI